MRGARGATCARGTSSRSPLRRSCSASSSSGPIRIAVYGSDLFRSGGGDDGTGNVVFEAILAAIGLWAFGLLVYGISVVERWTAVRALVAIGLVVLGLLIVTFPFLIPLASR